ITHGCLDLVEHRFVVILCALGVAQQRTFSPLRHEGGHRSWSRRRCILMSAEGAQHRRLAINNRAKPVPFPRPIDEVIRTVALIHALVARLAHCVACLTNLTRCALSSGSRAASRCARSTTA